MTIPVYDHTGKSVKELNVSKSVFDVSMNTDLVHQVARILGLRTRKVIAHVKDRSEVRGGGKKPWKQKGTGRARHGSIRSPLWKGGGVTHGPSNDRNFVLDVNKKMKNIALRMVLSSRVRENHFLVLDQPPLFDGYKTKDASAFFTSFLKTLDVKGKALFVHTFDDAKNARAIWNLKSVQWIPSNNLGLLGVLTYPIIICTEQSVREIESMVESKSKQSVKPVYK